MLENVNGLFIEEDAPESRLKLEWHGAPPGLGWRRLILFLAITAFAGAVYLGISAVNLAGGNPQQQGDAVIFGFMAFIILCLIHYVGLFAGSLLGYWQRFTWDAADGMFVAQRRGWLGWGRETRAIPFAAIRLQALEMASESQVPVPAVFSLTTRKFETFKADITSLGFEQRSEGLSFLLDVARLIRAEGYRVHENTPRKQVLQVWTTRIDYAGVEEPDDDEDDRPEVDFLSVPARGTRLSVPVAAKPPFQDSVQSKAPLDLARLRESLLTTRIEDWLPGELVRIVRPSAPWFVHVLVVGLAMAAATALGYWFVFGFLQNVIAIENDSRLFVTGFTAVTFGCIMAFLCWNNLQERELILDWRQNCLTLRFGLNVRQWPLSEIQQLVLST
ncbi:MAG: hypothetical protein JWM11_441, partial [Planctomycetaceae bacterium]|nr:hypothetical protein [Planctomycetaceae bacterium]